MAARDRVGLNELHRRMWHIAPGVLAVLFAPIPHAEPLSTAWQSLIAFLSLGLLGLAITFRESFSRPTAPNCLGALAGYAITVVALLLLFPSQSELGLTVMGILAFGDGCATLVGLLFGRKKLPWNPNKSWAGAVAFLIAALPMATLIYWAASMPRVSFETAFLVVTPAVVAAGVVESIIWSFNDNLAVGVCAAATLIATHAMLVGWS